MSTSVTKPVKEETWQEREAREAKEFKDTHLPNFFKTMKDKDIKYFTVDFNGGGDDGMVDDPVYVKESDIPSWHQIRDEVGITDDMKWDDPEFKKLNKKADALKRFYMDPDRIGNMYVYAELQYDTQPRSYSMDEYIKEFVGMYMSAKSIDWYNNEGGSGTFTYTDGHLQIEGETYYRSEDPFEFEESDSKVVKNG